MARSYQNFDPTSEWIDEEGSKTLTINLPEFKKEQIRVQLNAPQNLKISGERNLGNNKWSCFEKNVQIPNNCDINGLRAKFDGEILSIIMPKIITPVQPQVQTILTQSAPPSKKPVTEPKPQVPPNTTPEAPPSQKPETGTPPKTALQKPPSQKPEIKTPPETAFQKPPGQKPVSEPESSQPPPSQKHAAEKTPEKEQGKVDGSAAGGESKRYENTAKAKEGVNDDDGGARVNKEDSSTGSGVAATVANDLTMGVYGPKQLIVNVVVGLLVVLALVIYVKYSLGRSSTRATTDSD
ncbi:putative proline-rich receptor-like protein kinase PERK11 [Macadamia integrifolia]|uniref:putative proline-rich receptor-like protein kinase PERK11 n=1 Tax=Macadamia integrifolia TaxID=60698 RepID=UPI001C4F9047|nr:putative proline-rich receptor-like protein kinase PERK11 [Macadamia integrifolia]